VLDKAGASANTLDDEVLGELDQILDIMEADRPTGLVIRSAKPSGFIAGADVSQFRGATDVNEVEQRMARAHAIADRLEGQPYQTIAVVHGYALGGGLEVALACKVRIAVEGAKFGFPGGPARPASRPGRHGAVHAADRSAAGHELHADRQDHRGEEGQGPGPGRRRRARASRPRRREAPPSVASCTARARA
jgi:1,4-dihydroxy-2-naphthoyl-CoA synthase